MSYVLLWELTLPVHGPISENQANKTMKGQMLTLGLMTNHQKTDSHLQRYLHHPQHEGLKSMMR